MTVFVFSLKRFLAALVSLHPPPAQPATALLFLRRSSCYMLRRVVFIYWTVSIVSFLLYYFETGCITDRNRLVIVQVVAVSTLQPIYQFDGTIV